MPIPSKNPDENQSAFVSRCMSNETMKQEYSDPKQRAAICLSQTSGCENDNILQYVHDNIWISNATWDDEWNEFVWETEVSTIFDEDGRVLAAEKGGRKVTLNKPFRTPGGPKKFSVYVKNDKGNVVKVNFGDPNMKIKKNIPERRKSFRARHNCDNPGPKWKARYWACKSW
jgi:hypothetical protein